MTGEATRHRDALIAYGIDPETAHEWVDEGLTVTIADTVVLLSEFTDPVNREEHALVTVGADTILSDDEVRAAVLAHVRRALPEADVLTLRTTSTAPPPAEATVRMRYVERVCPPEIVAPAGWEVRPFGAGDADDVTRLLVAALAAGSATGTWNEDSTGEVAADLLSRIGDDVAVYCATYDGRFAGHGTVVHERDDLTDAPQLELFDIYVIDEFRGSVAGKLLQQATVRHAVEHGTPLRGHVVGGDEQAAAVLAHLQEDGWRVAETYVSLPVNPVSP